MNLADLLLAPTPCTKDDCKNPECVTEASSIQQSDIVQEAWRFNRFHPNVSRFSRSHSESDPICIFRMIKTDGICPDSVPILPNAIRQRLDSDPTLTEQIWTESGRNRQKTAMNVFPDHARSSRQRPDPQDTVQTTQDIIEI